ncbi:biopolymer transport protein ExbB [bacterium BMS3Bbin04]|nr:biopolymer transport protein ExbB [bacterium BMS3Bbin04]
MDMWTIVRDASPVNQLLLLLLIALSVLSWGVVIERWRYFRVARKADTDFFTALRGSLDATQVHRIAESKPKSPAGRVYLASERELQRLGRNDAAAWAEIFDIEGNALRVDGERGLPLLAIIASTAPFIGLLGTVWGVMIAFLRLGGMQGQPALEVVGPGIAEALIATAMGLFAAIPAMVAYNVYAAAQRNLLLRSEEFGRRLVISIRQAGSF